MNPAQKIGRQSGHIPFQQNAGADIINLGTDIFGVIGVREAAAEFCENAVQSTFGMFELPGIQTVFEMKQIYGIFSRQIRSSRIHSLFKKRQTIF